MGSNRRHKAAMGKSTQILCIGSVLWDIIGRAPIAMRRGEDLPGRITRLPGGVAMNIAMALAGFDLPVALLSAVGRDAEGDELVRAARRMGLNTEYLFRTPDLPTDRYMAVEAENGLIAAIADAHSLEAAGMRILEPLTDGRLAGPDLQWAGLAVVDGNLPVEMLRLIATGSMFAACDLRIAPASPGKADRLKGFLGHRNAVLYLNLAEANLLCNGQHKQAADAAAALIALGLVRVLVTNGGGATAEARTGGFAQSQMPPVVPVSRVTGAGDMFMAAHIAAELGGKTAEGALRSALVATATYISNGTH